MHMRPLPLLAIACALSAIGITARSQTSGEQFEVAIVKPNRSLSGLSSQRLESGGRFRAVNVSLKRMIMYAYRLQGFQISFTDDWVETDRYDIIAKAESNVTQTQLYPILQNLLRDRFKLATHMETREVPVYALTIAKNGSKIRPSVFTDCSETKSIPDGRPCHGFNFRARGARGDLSRGGSMGGVAVSATAFAEGLQRIVGRPVIDETGLMGLFDITLRWDDESSVEHAGPFLAALEDQLGLKLRSDKGRVSVMVLDQVQRPKDD
jgi:uncharacterized protein (TIGR03435 family)